MDTTERTRDIYEHIEAYPKPPLIPLPNEADIKNFLEELGREGGKGLQWTMKAAMALTGFNRFLKRLPDRLEAILRQSDLRGGGLFSPVISATLALKDDSRSLTPVQRAATLIMAARSLYRDIMSGRLEPDRYKDQILEMGQYPNLFSTCLIVEGKRARIFKSKDASYIIVIVNGTFYKLPIGEPESEIALEVLQAALANIIGDAQQRKNRADDVSPGILTVAQHGTQLRIFQQLQRNEINRASLLELRHSFLTLCFDLESQPEDDAALALESHVGNNANRWFHSSLQIVVFGNARASVICNFSTYLDGNPMMRAAAELQQRAQACPVGARASQAATSQAPATRLHWDIDARFIQLAERDFQRIRDNQPATYKIKGIGKRFLTEHNFQPIPIFIVALQMAIRELIGRDLRITQFMTMSRFRCMDLVTPNVTTPAMIRLVDYLSSPNVQDRQVVALLREAIASQLEVMSKERKKLPIPDAMHLQIFAERGWRRFYVSLIIFLRMMLFNLLGASKKLGREVLVSHPEIYPEVPVVGRPGVRLPYVNYFGLHYQILEEKIVITFMPGLRWKISNSEIIKVLEKSLKRLSAIIENFNNA